MTDKKFPSFFSSEQVGFEEPCTSDIECADGRICESISGSMICRGGLE